MKNKIQVFLANICLAVILSAPITAQAADESGKHPAFLNALSDLRYARALIEKGEGDIAARIHLDAAQLHIENAINKIKQASIDDGKALNEHPVIDEKVEKGDRLHNAVGILQKSYTDVDERETDPAPSVTALKGEALKHIHEAANEIRAAIDDLERKK